MKPPEISVSGGNPTPEEERAVREAIIALWREDQMDAANESAGWVRVARLESAGGGASHVRSWRASAGFMQPGTLGARRAGRGDTR